jgi:hypothetical protein
LSGGASAQVAVATATAIVAKDLSRGRISWARDVLKERLATALMLLTDETLLLTAVFVNGLEHYVTVITIANSRLTS